MRILTWNMDHWKQRASHRELAWSFLKDQSPTVALLQEANPPEHFGGSVQRERRITPVGNRSFRPWT